MKNTNERLEELLEAKDAELAELQSQLAEFRERDDSDSERKAWEWTQHRKVNDDPRLPIPRLEMRLVVYADDYNWEWNYSLVYRHFGGELIAVPLGLTRCSGKPPSEHDDPDQRLPFRDGAHIKCDAAQLKLPMLAIIGRRVEVIKPLKEYPPSHWKEQQGGKMGAWR